MTQTNQEVPGMVDEDRMLLATLQQRPYWNMLLILNKSINGVTEWKNQGVRLRKMLIDRLLKKEKAKYSVLFPLTGPLLQSYARLCRIFYKQTWDLQKRISHNHNHFTALFPGPPGWAGARRELLDFMVQGKINRGRHTDHPAGRHSIWTNQCPLPPSPSHKLDVLPIT